MISTPLEELSHQQDGRGEPTDCGVLAHAVLCETAKRRKTVAPDVARRLDEEAEQWEALTYAWECFENNYDPGLSARRTYAYYAAQCGVKRVIQRLVREERGTISLDGHEKAVHPHAAVEARLDFEAIAGPLRPEDRTLLRRYYVEGYTQAEIAEELEVSRATVGQRLRRLGALLRARYERRGRG